MTPLEIERDGAIAIVTMNMAHQRNALSDPLIEALCDMLERAQADHDLGAIVLTGAGDDFCSGGNIKDMASGASPMFAGSPAQMQNAYRRLVQRIPRLFAETDIPVIAAVQGNAIGAGCDLACMADIRIAAENAVFAESFLRVGLISGDGGAWFLPRVVGVSRAMEMALTCNPLNAAKAESWGLVSEVVPLADLRDRAVAVARRIASFPIRSVRLNKRLVRQSAELGLPESLELAASYQAIVQSTADTKEAVAALLEKRKPDYSGR